MENIRQNLAELIQLLKEHKEKSLANILQIITLLSKSDPKEDTLVPTKVAVELLNICEKTLYSMRKAGQIPYTKIRGTYWYKLTDIERLNGNNSNG